MKKLFGVSKYEKLPQNAFKDLDGDKHRNSNGVRWCYREFLSSFLKGNVAFDGWWLLQQPIDQYNVQVQ